MSIMGCGEGLPTTGVVVPMIQVFGFEPSPGQGADPPGDGRRGHQDGGDEDHGREDGDPPPERLNQFHPPPGSMRLIRRRDQFL